MIDPDRSVVTHDVLAPGIRPAVTLLVESIVAKCGVPAPLHEAEQTIQAMRAAIETMWPETAEMYHELAAEVIRQIAVDIAPHVVLAPGFKPWFDDAVVNGRVSLERWYSYKQFLTHDKNYPPLVLDELDQASGEIVDLLGDPAQPGSWKRRGLVIGDVQSGKTAAYIGIVNKAADAGYKLVVLLTGGTESLRKQTQYRVDEGFLGKDSSVQQDKVIGVGKFPTRTQFLRGQGMTTHMKDFVSSSLSGQAVYIDPNADHPYVFVIKKNKTPLDNLITWMAGQFLGEQFDIPMLVVDDESDYASVNTNYKASGEANPTLINQKIRELLALTTRSSYMAFTATPFANVFIDHKSFTEALRDDLFPHHYIMALSSPSNYSGAATYFSSTSDTESGGLVDITDAAGTFPPKHKSDLIVTTLPTSLTDALDAFVVASAIRIVRGDHSARAMLVNVSRFMSVQKQVYDQIAQEFADIKTAIEIHAQPPVIGDVHPVLRRLRKTFDDRFSGTGSTWEDTRDKLFAAVFDTKVELFNSKRDKSSDDKTRNMIAVGGDVLSRGLTLDGLTISYFYRLVGAADTLLQMARWFGYRPGYEDLVRVWISSDVADQFRFVAKLTHELRDQIHEMRELGQTPKDFGLMIRKHPETLAITAKKGVAEAHSMVISLSGRNIETIRIPSANSILTGNSNAVRDFLVSIHTDDPAKGWRTAGMKFPGKTGIARDRVADLLEHFRYDRGNLIMANALHKIIRDQTAPAFQNWTIGLVGGDGPPLELIPGLKLPSTPIRAVRYSPDTHKGVFRISGRNARLAGSVDLAKTYAHDGPDLREPAVYASLPHPTILIYPVHPDFKIKSDAENNYSMEIAAAEDAWAEASVGMPGCLMALKMAIPGEPGARGGDVTYLLNGPAIEQYRQDFTLSDDDLVDLDD